MLAHSTRRWTCWPEHSRDRSTSCSAPGSSSSRPGRLRSAAQHTSDAPSLLLIAATTLAPLDEELARETYGQAILAARFVERLTSGVGLHELAQAVRATPPYAFAGELDIAAALVEELEAVNKATGSKLAPYGRLVVVAWGVVKPRR